MPGIEGQNILVLGGGGMVGTAVCRELIAHRPARMVVAARRQAKARRTVEQLKNEFPDMADRLVPVWGDVFLRADWNSDNEDIRSDVLSDAGKRKDAIADILGPLDDAILRASFLFRLVEGSADGLGGVPADVVIDCMNTATAVSYQDIYSLAQRMMDLAEKGDSDTDWPGEISTLVAALSVPQLVRHIQILYAAMKQAGTGAYIKVGTSGTGGMGFNIPYTHGEEKPSRLLLSKAALAGAQTLLTFLMARTPDAPPMVRELKPTALIGWHEIGFGPIRRHGQEYMLYDCPLEQAVSAKDGANLVPSGEFGCETGERLKGVYIDTGENGLFSADEFAAITMVGQMQLITPEEVAHSVVAELTGVNTGHDVVAALDSAVSGPTYRGGYLRQSAMARLRNLEAEHDQAVAFEILGPPRLSKLLYEAFLLAKASAGDMAKAIQSPPEQLADAIAEQVRDSADTRRRILSIGVPILMPDGDRLLRGPVIKSRDAHHGWVDLTAANMSKWQERLRKLQSVIKAEVENDTSSRHPHLFSAGYDLVGKEKFPNIGEIVGWILQTEDEGRRQKG